MFSSPQKVALCPFAISFLPLFQPQQPHVISVFIVLSFLECHINGIVKYVGFCGKFLLLSIRLLRFHVVAGISSLLVTAFWNWIRIPFNFGTTVKNCTALDISLILWLFYIYTEFMDVFMYALCMYVCIGHNVICSFLPLTSKKFVIGVISDIYLY